jgi:hypothetical protein
MSQGPFSTGVFQPTITVVVAGSFNGTTTYRLEPVDLRQSPVFRLIRRQEGGYEAGTRELKLQGAELSALVQKVEAARLPPLAAGPLGCDGTTYTVTLKTGMVEATWCWWNRTPEGWGPLAEIVSELIQLSTGRRT